MMASDYVNHHGVVCLLWLLPCFYLTDGSVNNRPVKSVGLVCSRNLKKIYVCVRETLSLSTPSLTRLFFSLYQLSITFHIHTYIHISYPTPLFFISIISYFYYSNMVNKPDLICPFLYASTCSFAALICFMM